MTRSSSPHALAPSSQTPRKIRCTTTADFIAAVPQLAGFVAPNSIFMVLFSGSLARSAVRIDLPNDDEPGQSIQLLEVLARILHETSEVGDGPAILIRTDQTFGDSGGTPWRHLANRIRHRLSREGFRVRELCCEAPDGWASYFDSSPPANGRSLREIHESVVALEAVTRGFHPPSIETVGALPAPDPELCDAVATQLSFERDAPEGTSSSSAEDEYWITTTAALGAPQLVLMPADELDPVACARFIRRTHHSDGWLLLALVLLTGPEFASKVSEEIGPEWLAHHPLEGDAMVHEWSLLSTVTSLASVPLDREYHRAATDYVARIASLAPQSEQSGPLTLLAWMWWRQGMRSVADRHLAAARSIDPASPLVHVLDRLFESVGTPGWEPIA
ncbi:MAG: DUF4192 family protein [Leucobacter sp.]